MLFRSGAQVEGIGSYAGHLLPSAAIPGKQLPTFQIKGEIGGFGRKKLNLGGGIYITLSCLASSVSYLAAPAEDTASACSQDKHESCTGQS